MPALPSRRRFHAELAVTLFLLACSAVAPTLAEAPAPLPSSAQLQADRMMFMHTAEAGVRAINRHWWNSRRRWYNERATRDRTGRATLWTTVHLFSTLNAVAIADPTPANIQALNWFAGRAYREYWNPWGARVGNHWVGGYAPSSYQHGAHAHMFFDDNGWLGLAFYDAYRATGNRRYLQNADKAFQFIARAGWARRLGGGVYWDNRTSSRSSESIASNTLLGALLYESTRNPAYLRVVKRYTSWADAHILDHKTGLYMREPTSPILMGYVQSPMMVAYASLCATTRQDSLCDRAGQLGRAALRYFTMDLDHGPQYDAEYLHWMLELYSRDHDSRWYSLAYNNAQRALKNARTGSGLFLRGWDGKRPPDAPWDDLRFQAATISVFAWLAAATPPASS